MVRCAGRLILMTAVLVGLTQTGCTRSVVKQKSPPDPLLLSKKPMMGRDAPWEPSERVDLKMPPPPPSLRPAPAGHNWAAPEMNRDPISGARLSPPPPAPTQASASRD